MEQQPLPLQVNVNEISLLHIEKKKNLEYDDDDNDNDNNKCRVNVVGYVGDTDDSDSVVNEEEKLVENDDDNDNDNDNAMIEVKSSTKNPGDDNDDDNDNDNAIIEVKSSASNVKHELDDDVSVQDEDQEKGAQEEENEEDMDEINIDDGNSTGKISDISEISLFSRARWKRWFRRRGNNNDVIDEEEWYDINDNDTQQYDHQDEFLPFCDRSILIKSDASACYSIRERMNVGEPMSRLGRFILRRNNINCTPEYYMTLASELNNVAANLYNRKQYATAIDLLKDAVRAVKSSMNHPDKKEWLELDSLDYDTKCIAKKIVNGKELVQDIDARELRKSKNIMGLLHEPERIDIFHWPKSIQSQGRPKWLLKPLYVDLSQQQTNNTNNTEQQRKYGCIGAFILFNLGLIYTKRHEYPASLKYFQMAIDLVKPKDYQDHFHQDYIVFISLHNNIGCIEYIQNYDLTHNPLNCNGVTIGMQRMCQVALEEFQFAFHLCRFYRASLREYENIPMPNRTSYEDTTKIVNTYMGTIATNIARVYFDRKQDDEAIDLCNDALESFILAYGPNKEELDIKNDLDDGDATITELEHIDVATSYYNLGVIHYKNEKYSKAMEYYNNFFRFIGAQQQSNNISIKTSSSSFIDTTTTSTTTMPSLYASEDTTTALLNSLIVMCKLDKNAKNEHLHDLVCNLQTLRCEFGYEHPDIPSLLDEIANLLKELNENNEYITYLLDEAIRVEEALKEV